MLTLLALYFTIGLPLMIYWDTRYTGHVMKAWEPLAPTWSALNIAMNIAIDVCGWPFVLVGHWAGQRVNRALLAKITAFIAASQAGQVQPQADPAAHDDH
jgi:hypothetical protein